MNSTEHIHQLREQINALQKQLQATLVANKRDAINQIKSIMREYEINPSEIGNPLIIKGGTFSAAALARKELDSNPNITRQEFLALAKQHNLNLSTASVQLNKERRRRQNQATNNPSIQTL